MTKKKIIEGNRLITQFMDWELIQTKDELKVWVFKNKKTGRVLLLDDADPYNKKFWNKDSVIDFRESWDVLIPVLNKAYGIINGINHYTWRTRLFNVLNTFLCDDYDKKGNKKELYRIEKVWKHLVDFIQDYERFKNEQEILKKVKVRKNEGKGIN